MGKATAQQLASLLRGMRQPVVVGAIRIADYRWSKGVLWELLREETILKDSDKGTLMQVPFVRDS